MFRSGIATGHEDIEYNPAAGTERAMDTLPKRTRYPDDQHADAPASSSDSERSSTSGSARGGRSWAGSFNCGR